MVPAPAARAVAGKRLRFSVRLLCCYIPRNIYPSNLLFPCPVPPWSPPACPQHSGHWLNWSLPTVTPQAAAKGAPGHYYSQRSPLILRDDNNRVEHLVPAGDSASSALIHPRASPKPPMPFAGLADLDSSHGMALQSHPQCLFSLLLLQSGCLLTSRLLALGMKHFFRFSPPKSQVTLAGAMAQPKHSPTSQSLSPSSAAHGLPGTVT